MCQTNSEDKSLWRPVVQRVEDGRGGRGEKALCSAALLRGWKRCSSLVWCGSLLRLSGVRGEGGTSVNG